jgi:hypothetical protein
MVLPGKITLKGGACAIRRTRPQGAPLTVILGGKRMPGTEDGPGPDYAGAGIGAPLRRVLPACGSGGGRPDGGGAPRRAPARRGATWPPPPSRTVPLSLPRYGLVVVPVSVTHPRSMTSRPLPASGPRPGAWRAGGAPLKLALAQLPALHSRKPSSHPTNLARVWHASAATSHEHLRPTGPYNC